MKLNYLIFICIISSIHLIKLQAQVQSAKPSTQALKAQTEQPIPLKKKPRRMPNYYTEINSMNEYNRIVNSPKPSVIMYEAPWCTACDMMQQPFDKVAQENLGFAHFCSVNLDNEQFEHFIKDHEIQGLPTTIYCQNGQELKRERGCMETPKEINASIKQFKEILKAPPAQKSIKKAPVANAPQAQKSHSKSENIN